MPSIGPGVREIRIRDPGGAFRVIYVAKFSDAVFILHCFRKTTQKTASADIWRNADTQTSFVSDSRDRSKIRQRLGRH
jgi:phage-related protein